MARAVRRITDGPGLDIRSAHQTLLHYFIIINLSTAEIYAPMLPRIRRSSSAAQIIAFIVHSIETVRQSDRLLENVNLCNYAFNEMIARYRASTRGYRLFSRCNGCVS